MANRNITPAARKRTRSQHEEEPSSTASKRRRLRSSDDPRGTQQENGKTQRKKLQPVVGGQTSSVYDVPDSGEDELTTAEVAPNPKRQSSGVAAAVAKHGVDTVPLSRGDEPGKRKRGRPGKRDREAQGEAQNGLVAPAGMPNASSPRPAPRPARSTRRGAPPSSVSLQATNEESHGGLTAKDLPGARTRHPPAGANGRPEGESQLPKGILTPRKRRHVGDRRPKSVAFDSRPDLEVSEELAAETPSRSLRKRRQIAPVEVADEPEVNGEPTVDDQTSEKESNGDQQDDEVCAICAKPDSQPLNEIVFCDNCDMAVHQECYGLPEIPEGDWICRNCSQDGASSVSQGGLTDQAQSSVITRPEVRPDIPNFDQHLRSMQRVLLDRCAGRRRIKLRGQSDAYEKAYQLVEQTVGAGEGNSMLVIGARGCGKTTLVESIVSAMPDHHKEQFHVVRLNGFIHTDDKLALREIWRQLGKEMEVEDELVNKPTNYSDTMASLLALLSHPSEISETQDGVTSKSIVFVIDEFDLFATHARQTLLYNLLDIAQARKAPIAVLGLTTRIDVVESLEKRVKSRFSHRYVYLSLPKSLPAYWDICRQGLRIDDEDMVLEGIDPGLKGHRAFWDWWNGKIEALRQTPSFMDHLESHFYSTKSVSAFLTTCILPLATLSPEVPSLQMPTVPGLSISLEPPDSKLHLLGSLSDLDLSMLIAAARLDIVAHTDTVNFAMAYDEYTSLMGRQRVQSSSSGMLALGGGARVWGRGIAGIAWERLAALGLLVPAAAGGRGTAGLGGLDAKMWKLDVALEEIPAATKLNAVLARWCREI